MRPSAVAPKRRATPRCGHGDARTGAGDSLRGGWLGDAQYRCACAIQQVQRYRSRVSGPLLDRIDLHVEVRPVPYRELADNAPGEASAAVRARVHAARRIQLEHFAGRGIFGNALMGAAAVRRFAAVDAVAAQLLQRAMHAVARSARAYTRILEVAGTIADLAGAESITAAHVAKAVQYRALDRAVGCRTPPLPSLADLHGV